LCTVDEALATPAIAATPPKLAMTYNPNHTKQLFALVILLLPTPKPHQTTLLLLILLSPPKPHQTTLLVLPSTGNKKTSKLRFPTPEQPYNLSQGTYNKQQQPPPPPPS
jgi:hypothetical protein